MPKKIDTQFGSFQTHKCHFLVVGVKMSENQTSTFGNVSHISKTLLTNSALEHWNINTFSVVAIQSDFCDASALGWVKIDKVVLGCGSRL